MTVGEKAPDFVATITDGTTITLSEILSSGDRLILYFYLVTTHPDVRHRLVTSETTLVDWREVDGR